MQPPRQRLSRAEREQFEERGLVKLEGLITRTNCEAMADRLWAELERKDGIRRVDRSTWRAERPWGFGPFQKTGAFTAMATPELRGVLDDLSGPGRWIEPQAWGQPLPCFPATNGPWNVPHQVWHFDLTPDPSRAGMMVGRLFVLLAPLLARGGGTLVAAGSHRIAAGHAERRGVHVGSQEMRRRLVKEHRWFADLMSPPKAGENRIARFMGAASVVDGVPLQVEEMTGEPGDVFLMHPNALHAPSSNALDTPRLALAQTVYPKGWV